MIPNHSTMFLIWIIVNNECMAWKELHELHALVQNRLILKMCHLVFWFGFIFGATLII